MNNDEVIQVQRSVEFNEDQEVVDQQDAAMLEEANYWFTINEFVELILRYGPQTVLPDFEKQMEKAKAVLRNAPRIMVP